MKTSNKFLTLGTISTIVVAAPLIAIAARQENHKWVEVDIQNETFKIDLAKVTGYGVYSVTKTVGQPNRNTNTGVEETVTTYYIRVQYNEVSRTYEISESTYRDLKK
ncbi:hypothetical protein [Mycoplasma todarodis]|uniref:hypothetical protein n=1 Tax=Mycoplasma todarodis TaxID=1937191 RepID=UPI003B2BDEC9